MFTNATNIQNSILTQAAGTVNVSGKLNLPTTGVATATAGKSSRPEDFVASSFNSTSSVAVPQTFQLQAEPAANNTAAPSGTLNFLYGSGTTAPKETGFRIGSNGLLSFAPGQTFPGTSTITGVATVAGSGLTGGGTSGALSLGLLKTCSTNQTLQWNGSSWICATLGGTITGVTAGTDLTGGGTSGSVTLNVDTTKIPQLLSNNTYTGTQKFPAIPGIGTVPAATGYTPFRWAVRLRSEPGSRSPTPAPAATPGTSSPPAAATPKAQAISASPISPARARSGWKAIPTPPTSRRPGLWVRPRSW